MLHTVRSATAPGDHAALRAMFAARKSVFIDLLKWTVPVIDGRYEIDQFDNEHAIYLVLVDPDGQHLGSTRLLPTMRPHILDSLYPDLCDKAPPRDPATYEITKRGSHASALRSRSALQVTTTGEILKSEVAAN